ncbi:basic proline-rich protein-like [Dromiciops gliroides]|uniref:basic proline-rich protein-like n=1 Tax=Dromiciops gliroides TaxID=33562 RepID=UPI001CC7CF1F|nr:basic proline-rich protein-like [Dromiciops gliroides]
MRLLTQTTCMHFLVRAAGTMRRGREGVCPGRRAPFPSGELSKARRRPSEPLAGKASGLPALPRPPPPPHPAPASRCSQRGKVTTGALRPPPLPRRPRAQHRPPPYRPLSLTHVASISSDPPPTPSPFPPHPPNKKRPQVGLTARPGPPLAGRAAPSCLPRQGLCGSSLSSPPRPFLSRLWSLASLCPLPHSLLTPVRKSREALSASIPRPRGRVAKRTLAPPTGHRREQPLLRAGRAREEPRQAPSPTNEASRLQWAWHRF